MNKDVFIRKMQKVEELRALMDNFDSHLGAIAPGGVFEFGVIILDEYIELLANYAEDGGDWISWYIFENDFGKREFEAGYDGHMTKIRNLDDLWDLMEEGRKR